MSTPIDRLFSSMPVAALIADPTVLHSTITSLNSQEPGRTSGSQVTSKALCDAP